MKAQKFIIIFLFVISSATVFAQIDSYSWVEGPEGMLECGVIASGKEDSIRVIEFEHKIWLPYDEETGQITGSRRHGALTMIKEFDQCSPILYQYTCEGTSIPSVELKWYRMNQAQEEEYFIIFLEDVNVVSINALMHNLDDPDNDNFQPMENISMLYRHITWTYVPTNSTSGGGQDYIFFDIPLLTGWNLISMPIRPANTNINYVIGDLIDHIVVWNYNMYANSWSVYDSNAPNAVNTLTQMFFSRAYWIKSNLNQTLRIEGTEALDYTINLKEGWNFVGYNLSTSQMPDPIDNLTYPIVVWTYDTEADEWQVYDTTGALPNTLGDMSQGKGYWLKSDINQSWMI